jgi:hypothetical protein
LIINSLRYRIKYGGGTTVTNVLKHTIFTLIAKKYIYTSILKTFLFKKNCESLNNLVYPNQYKNKTINHVMYDIWKRSHVKKCLNRTPWLKKKLHWFKDTTCNKVYFIHILNKSESTPLSINDRSIRIMKGAI